MGLDVNSSVSRDDVKGAAEAAKAYDGPGNVLVCWEHGQLALIAKAMGIEKFAKGSGDHGEEIKYPDNRFDLIWTVKAPYKEIESVTSEDVPGLDNGLPKP